MSNTAVGRLALASALAGLTVLSVTSAAAAGTTLKVKKFGSNDRAHAEGTVNVTSNGWKFTTQFTIWPHKGETVYLQIQPQIRDAGKHHYIWRDWGPHTKKKTVQAREGDYRELYKDAIGIKPDGYKFRVCKHKKWDTDSCGGDSKPVYFK